MILQNKVTKLTSHAAIIATEGLPEEKFAQKRATIEECLKANKDILTEVIPAEYHETFFNTPETVDKATLISVLSAIEPVKLSMKERLSPHGWRVIRMVNQEKKLVDFIRMWRQHFIDTMHPKSLPFMWDNRPEVYASFGVSPPSEDECKRLLKLKNPKTSPDESLI